MPSVVGSPLVYQQKWSFTVEIQDVEVGGFSKAGPLKQSMALQEQKEGGAPFPVDYTPIGGKTEKLTLERGSSSNIELWKWWDAIRSGKLDRRDVVVTALDSSGNPLTVWFYPSCIITEFDAGDFDAKNDTENVVEKLVLQPYYLDQSRILGGG